MALAAKWLQGLLGMKEGKENVGNNSNYVEKKEKKRWSFAANSSKVSGGLSQIPVTNPATVSAWPRQTRNRTSTQLEAAAADAAVAAVQVAVASNINMSQRFNN